MDSQREWRRFPARVLLEHFLYRSPEKAAQAQARLKKGANYEELAESKQRNSDTLLVERRWFTPDLLIPEVREVAFRLSAGEVSEVIRSPYGYHVVRADTQEPSRYKEFSAARLEIPEKIRQARAGRRFDDALEETKRLHGVRLHAEPGKP